VQRAPRQLQPLCRRQLARILVGVVAPAVQRQRSLLRCLHCSADRLTGAQRPARRFCCGRLRLGGVSWCLRRGCRRQRLLQRHLRGCRPALARRELLQRLPEEACWRPRPLALALAAALAAAVPAARQHEAVAAAYAVRHAAAAGAAAAGAAGARARAVAICGSLPCGGPVGGVHEVAAARVPGPLLLLLLRCLLLSVQPVRSRPARQG
jgi:hypothetical protein